MRNFSWLRIWRILDLDRCIQDGKDQYANIKADIIDIQSTDIMGTKRKRDGRHLSESPKRRRHENEQLDRHHRAQIEDRGQENVSSETERRPIALEKSMEAVNASIIQNQGHLLQAQELRTRYSNDIESIPERELALQMRKSAFCSLKRSEVPHRPILPHQIMISLFTNLVLLQGPQG